MDGQTSFGNQELRVGDLTAKTPRIAKFAKDKMDKKSGVPH